tara:strand:- start:7171 stop:7953 length:783 start_codon:yes stop_codon:yes gene_type:complete
MRKLVMLIGASRAGTSYVHRSWFDNFRCSEKYFVPTIKEMQYFVKPREIEKRRALKELHKKRHGSLYQHEIDFINQYIDAKTTQDYINLWPDDKVSFDCTPNHCIMNPSKIKEIEPIIHGVGFIIRNPFYRDISAVKRLIDYRERYSHIDIKEHINFQRNISDYDKIIDNWQSICKDRFNVHLFDTIESVDWLNSFNKKLNIDSIEQLSNFKNESSVKDIPSEFIENIRKYNIEHISKLKCVNNETKEKWLAEVSANEYA